MESTDRIAEPWGARTPYPRGGVWPERADTHLGEGVEPGQVEAWVRTASVLHSDGDAMDIAVADGRMVGVRGRVEDRVNRGRLGPKDLFGWQANSAPDRLTRPLVREGGRLVESDWDTAMDRVVARSQDLLARSGPGSIGFYTSGQLFLEEYYTLAVLARTGIGTNHVDGNARLCTATADEALKQSFGCDGQPGSYSDVDAYVAAHAVGYEEVAKAVEACGPAWAAGICDVPAARIEEAAELLCGARALLSTVLQGFYQSHQATAAAVQVNNLHVLRGMLGRPGCGVLQMNGQPTAQNTRE